MVILAHHFIVIGYHFWSILSTRNSSGILYTHTLMKRFYLVSAWLLISSAIILTAIGSFQFYQLYQSQQPSLTTQAEIEQNVLISSPQQPKLTGEIKGVETVLESGDGRADLVANFLQRHNSPLTPHDYYGLKFVEIADKNGFDFRLLPAIAMQESNLCKAIPEGSYNCLGFGVHSRGTLKFENYEANFERAAKELKANYIDIGLTTPEQIMTKYTPSSDGSWAASVNQWMAEMRYDDRQLGRELKQDGSVLEFAEVTSTSEEE